MGISIIDNFDYRAGKPNFTRDLFDDLEAMVNFPEMYLPPVFEANLKSTGDRYRYNVNNEIDPLTGKWRLVTPGDGFAESYTKDEINAYLELKMDRPEVDGTEGQVLSKDADGNNVFIDPLQYDDTELRQLIEYIQLGNLNYEVVDVLPDPTLQTVDPNTIYMIKTDSNIVNQFIFMDGEFKSLGNTSGGGIGGVVDAEDTLYANATLDTVANVKEALDSIIEKIYYVSTAISSFTCVPSRTTYEMGEKIDTLQFNWVYNKDIERQMLNRVELDKTIRSATYNNISTNQTYSLEATDGKTTATKSISISFANGRYHGVAAEGEYDSTFILKLTKNLATSKNCSFTVTCGTDRYIFFAIPTRFGVPKFTVGGFEGGFTLVATIDFTNSSNYTEPYNIYKSENSNLGNTTVNVG
jgi:hypothetical protein